MNRRPGPEHDTIVGRGGSSSLADPQLISPRLRRRRAYSLVLLTLVAPGSAQLVAGNRAVGRVALRIAISLLIALVVVGAVFFVDRAFVINLFARPFMLNAAAVVAGLFALGWAGLFIDTLRLTRLRLVPTSTRRGVAALTAALMLLTSGTLAWGARALKISADTVGSVFGDNRVMRPSDGRYNILLLGGDSGADRVGTRPDTIMLASVDADTGKSVLFGFARDTENINFRPGSTMNGLMPEGWNCGDQCLLNGLYQWGHEHADQFPAGTKDPGVVATKEAVEALSGLDIQYYGLVDLVGFRRFIDAVGGINLNVGKATPIGGGTSPVKGYIQPGPQHLDGYHALWYARSREGSTNYERMERQRCVMTAMLHQLDPQTVMTKFQDIAAAAGSTLVTDIPAADIGTLGDLALKARSNKISSVNFVPPLIKPWDYDPQVIRDKVRATIEASGESAAPPASTRASTPRAASTPSPNTNSGATTSSSGGSSGGSGSTSDDLASVCSVL